MRVPLNKIYDLNEAREKIRGFCLYRERSQKEVRDKLYSYGLMSEVLDTLLSELIEERYLNEERFARAFVRGKCYQKRWGRFKIKQGLFSHDLSDYILKKAFQEIDPDLYFQNLQYVAERRWPLTKGKDKHERQQKLQVYLYNRGYENDLVHEVILELPD
jgi:regulatory protein